VADTPQPGSSQRQTLPLISELHNPFKPHLQLIREEAISQALISNSFPLHLQRASDNHDPWKHYTYSLQLGRILANASIWPPARGIVSPHGDLLTLIGYGGKVLLRTHAHQWICGSGDCLIAPARDWQWQNSHCSLVMFLVNPEHLLETAKRMAGYSLTPADWQQRIQDVQVLPTSSVPHTPCLQTALRQMLGLAEHLVGFSQSTINRLNLDDQIYRLLAVMMFPDLLDNSPLERLQRRNEQHRDGFDELLDFIKKHLQEPLNLALLAEHSHYSRRSLQYAFRERLGCTASQWIRNQRLDLARQRLQAPSQGSTVASIAAACGYRSTSLFSVDFQQRFRVKPSQLLREARLNQSP